MFIRPPLPPVASLSIISILIRNYHGVGLRPYQKFRSMAAYDDTLTLFNFSIIMIQYCIKDVG